MAKEKSITHRTRRNDIFMSIKPEHMHNIATGRSSHLVLHVVTRISHGKVPGEVPENGGIGNEDFNAGEKVSKYGYEILDLWKLREGISLESAISKGFLKGAPQKYCWVPVALLESCPLDRQDHIISSVPEERPVEKKKQHDPEEPKFSKRVHMWGRLF
ncbi:hypothetical protein BDV35DRAFT_385227 [Aspergillus flavus]|uniref:Uncharacterized protein n=1 Tax=Aspergillus flavus TaxID=5059 RepID=A0A5N6GFH5_ASPFL|nr:hypothetical protein BDV35DRAFT_385227 [Aspergillus flavus]